MPLLDFEKQRQKTVWGNTKYLTYFFSLKYNNFFYLNMFPIMKLSIYKNLKCKLYYFNGLRVIFFENYEIF